VEEPYVQLVYPVTTERLVIRPLATDDLLRHHAIFSNSDVVRYLYEEPFDLHGAQEHLARRCRVELPQEGEWLNLGVEVEGEGILIGELGLALLNATNRHCEIGYVFDPAFSGNGYATEGAAFMVEMAFSILNAHRVSARLDARNLSSQHLLERLGMRREGHLIENEFVKGEWTDEAVYAVLEEEWRARRSAPAPIAPRT
jgi:RimJ/RimL family protein N-acetyltransferase